MLNTVIHVCYEIILLNCNFRRDIIKQLFHLLFITQFFIYLIFFVIFIARTAKLTVEILLIGYVLDILFYSRL